MVKITTRLRFKESRVKAPMIEAVEAEEEQEVITTVASSRGILLKVREGLLMLHRIIQELEMLKHTFLLLIEEEEVKDIQHVEATLTSTITTSVRTPLLKSLQITQPISFNRNLILALNIIRRRNNSKRILHHRCIIRHRMSINKAFHI